MKTPQEAERDRGGRQQEAKTVCGVRMFHFTDVILEKQTKTVSVSFTQFIFVLRRVNEAVQLVLVQEKRET